MIIRYYRALADAVAAVTLVIGLAALITFAVFLWTTGLGLVDLEMDRDVALVWDGALCAVFIVQHSGMVRRSFRRWLGQSVPAHWHSAIYTIASGAALLLLAVGWQASGVMIAHVQEAPGYAMRGVFLLSMAGVVWSMRSLDNFDAFGIEALLAHVKSKQRRSSQLTIRGAYRWVRHPFYAFGIVSVWACPVLSADRLLFNVLFTIWIPAGAWLEERDMVEEFGDEYRAYQRRVPMLVPWRGAYRPD